MMVSYLKVICARPGGHIEAFGDLRSPKTSSQKPSESNFFKRKTLYVIEVSDSFIQMSGQNSPIPLLHSSRSLLRLTPWADREKESFTLGLSDSMVWWCFFKTLQILAKQGLSQKRLNSLLGSRIIISDFLLQCKFSFLSIRVSRQVFQSLEPSLIWLL